MDGSAGLTLTLNLDDQSLEVLENLAAVQHCTLAELVTSLVRKAVRIEEKQRRFRSPSLEEAPLDAFLPEGTDPFAPLPKVENELTSNFAETQTRMRFAGTSNLLRDVD